MNKLVFHYPYGASMEERVMAVLALLREPTVEEVAAVVVEMRGIASEKGVAECTGSVEEVLNSLITAGRVKTFSAPKRYKLTS